MRYCLDLHCSTVAASMKRCWYHSLFWPTDATTAVAAAVTVVQLKLTSVADASTWLGFSGHVEITRCCAFSVLLKQCTAAAAQLTKADLRGKQLGAVGSCTVEPVLCRIWNTVFGFLLFPAAGKHKAETAMWYSESLIWAIIWAGWRLHSGSCLLLPGHLNMI
jgi:hypothetical protein